MSGVNKVILIGNLGRDPEARVTTTGNNVVTASLAVSESWKDKDGKRQERTEWANLVFWRQQADIANRYLHKGDPDCVTFP